MKARYFLDQLDPSTGFLDSRYGEGVLGSEYVQRGYNIVSMDLNYSSKGVFNGDIVNAPHADDCFDITINLDNIEYFSFQHQKSGIKKFARILNLGGYFFLLVLNFPRFLSRLTSIFQGQLNKTSKTSRHPSDCPINKYPTLWGGYFQIRSREGIFPRFPILYL